MDGLSLSSEKLEPDGVYLLENGVDALVYIGKEAPSAVVQDLLGALLTIVPLYFLYSGWTGPPGSCYMWALPGWFGCAQAFPPATLMILVTVLDTVLSVALTHSMKASFERDALKACRCVLRWLNVLTGVESLDAVSATGGPPLSLQRLDTVASRAVNVVLDEARRQRGAYMRTRVLKRRDPLETSFYSALVEDRFGSMPSYVEYLCQLHRQIQNKT